MKIATETHFILLLRLRFAVEKKIMHYIIVTRFSKDRYPSPTLSAIIQIGQYLNY